jgi:hypothetical protein
MRRKIKLNEINGDIKVKNQINIKAAINKVKIELKCV